MLIYIWLNKASHGFFNVCQYVYIMCDSVQRVIGYHTEGARPCTMLCTLVCSCVRILSSLAAHVRASSVLACDMRGAVRVPPP